MDAASLLTGLLLGALLATAVTLGVVTLLSRNRPDDAGLEPVHESLDHLHRLLAGIERTAPQPTVSCGSRWARSARPRLS